MRQERRREVIAGAEGLGENIINLVRSDGPYRFCNLFGGFSLFCSNCCCCCVHLLMTMEYIRAVLSCCVMVWRAV